MPQRLAMEQWEQRMSNGDENITALDQLHEVVRYGLPPMR